ncbi:hypothetical protein DFJ74DRAFT_766884 [Hyaloraphidium curvatum]|nr:hypothetical protein DFJ74DRAFT_766884 [Hyaloraphidium curvatum]
MASPARGTPSPPLGARPPSASSLSLSASASGAASDGSGERGGPAGSREGRDAVVGRRVYAKLAALLIGARAVPQPPPRRRKPDVWFNIEAAEPDGAREAAAPWRDIGPRDGAPRMVVDVVLRAGRLRVGDGAGGAREVDASRGLLLETWALSRVPLPASAAPPPVSQSYLALTSFFRLLYSTLRLLPGHRIVRRLRAAAAPGDDAPVVEVYFGTERGRWGVELGEPFGGRDSGEWHTRVETGSGTYTLHCAYRTLADFSPVSAPAAVPRRAETDPLPRAASPYSSSLPSRNPQPIAHRPALTDHPPPARASPPPSQLSMTPLPVPYRRQSSSLSSSRPAVPSSLGRSSPRPLSSSPRGSFSSRDREDLRRRSLVGSASLVDDDAELQGFLGMVEGQRREVDMGGSFMGASVLRSGMHNPEDAMARSRVLEQSKIALARYSALAPTIASLSAAVDSLPRRSPGRGGLRPSRSGTLPRGPSSPTAAEPEPEPEAEPEPERGERAEEPEVRQRMPGGFPESGEDELVFEMSGITEGWG